jgi:hypothetical protein
LYETTKIPILAKRIQYKALPYLDANYNIVINTAGHWHKHNRYTEDREQRARSELCVYNHGISDKGYECTLESGQYL